MHGFSRGTLAEQAQLDSGRAPEKMAKLTPFPSQLARKG
jgi:hypothetical protein